MLISQRPDGKIAAGKWEFPGGKIEGGESARDALDRELHEELGIRLREARPLIVFTHAYSDRIVTLDTWLVTQWDGELHGREGQRFEWRAPITASELDVLPTVLPILRALELSQDYVFTPPTIKPEQLLRWLKAFERQTLVRLRQPYLDHAAYEQLARRMITAARPFGLRVVLDRGETMARRLGAAGVHFPQSVLMQIGTGELAPVKNVLRLASCHDAESLQRAAELGLDAAVLGHVMDTATHAGAAPLGWPRFAELARNANLPVYAIGGVGPADKPQAFDHHAQGVAGISAYWSRLGS